MSQSHTDFTSRFAIDPAAAAAMGTDELRHNFHIEGLFQPGRVSLTYTHYDRMIVGSAVPAATALPLEAIKPTGTKNFLDRRELIAVNIGGAGSVKAGGHSFELQARDMLYLGMGTTDVSFASANSNEPAKFYLLSAPAHHAHPNRLIRIGDAKRIDLGTKDSCNERSIFQFIHADGAKTCQLVVGMTQLAPGSIWNTMPCHVHDRRMEAYLYFDLADRPASSTSWASRTKRATSSCETRRRCCRRAGRSIPAQAPRTTPSSGRWPATMSTTPMSTRWRWANCGE